MCNILLNNVKHGELYSCRAESSLLKCYAMSTSQQIPTFRSIVVPSYSHLRIPNNIATLMACQKVLTILSGERIVKKRLLGLQTGFLDCLIMKMKTIRSFETSVTIFQSTWRQNNPEILIPLMQFE